MATKQQDTRSLVLAKEYADRIHNTDIPFAMAALWQKESYPKKTGRDRQSSERLELWGLDLERRRENGYGSTYYATLNAFRLSMGQFYHMHLHELHFRRFIDTHGRLWTPIAESDTRYGSEYAGNLMQFDPFACTNWSELSSWNTILRSQ